MIGNLFPAIVFAKSELPQIDLQAVPHTVGVGKMVLVDVVLMESEVKLNAIETSLTFDPNYFKFAGSRVSDSVIDLWVAAPYEEKSGSISLAGIIPGGAQHGGVVAHLEFSALQLGSADFSLALTQLGLQRVRGEVIAAPQKSLTVVIDGGLADMPRVTVNPETPIEFAQTSVGQNEALFSNKWFIPFVAKNKSADIDQYFVQETSLWQPKAGAWIPVTSPYVLEDQGRGSYVFLKARDIQGGEVIQEFAPQWFRQTKFWAAIASLVAGVGIVLALIFFRRRHHI